MNEAIKKAIEGGWSDRLYRVNTGNTEVWTHSESLVLDPLFWQALEKALKRNPREYRPWWLCFALEYFEFKLTGGDENKFWEKLL